MPSSAYPKCGGAGRRGSCAGYASPALSASSVSSSRHRRSSRARSGAVRRAVASELTALAGELGQMRPDRVVERDDKCGRLDAELGREPGTDARRPRQPGIAEHTRERERLEHGAIARDQRPPALVEQEPLELRVCEQPGRTGARERLPLDERRRGARPRRPGGLRACLALLGPGRVPERVGLGRSISFRGPWVGVGPPAAAVRFQTAACEMPRRLAYCCETRATGDRG
jgi:hypothetical protein